MAKKKDTIEKAQAQEGRNLSRAPFLLLSDLKVSALPRKIVQAKSAQKVVKQIKPRVIIRTTEAFEKRSDLKVTKTSRITALRAVIQPKMQNAMVAAPADSKDLKGIVSQPV